MPTALVVLLLTLLMAIPADARLRCGNGLVQTGDRTWDVERQCGEPDLRETLNYAVAPDGSLWSRIERWYYNQGPNQLIRMVDIRDGRVQAIRSGGYGYNTFPGSGCRAIDLRRGMNRMELLGKCGEPTAQQTLQPPTFVHGGRFGRGEVAPAREEWLYEFGPGQLQRIVILEQGRVIRVESGSRVR
ncbi:MAG: DUF2845 domain-containing protein [Ectothiorhodospiraceae bacterium]|nr:DUF2845 domain-containing protein [Ectothiorhodospiraceae bacterium]MCH8505744.1 DUF2845 domain-containing protein [Ectothiorhodospiraceae bacterium]